MELFDETLDINATENYDLTFEISEDGVSLAVLDLLRGKYVMLRHYPLLDPVENTMHSVEGIIEGDDFGPYRVRPPRARNMRRDVRHRLVRRL
jgi:hypothetical protein